MALTRSALVLAIALFATSASAQIGQGVLTGVVTDAQAAVLPGVTVTATSPSLIGTRTTTTEVDGRFRMPQLPSGIYKLRFELAGFTTFEREDIQVVIGQTITVDTSLKVAALAETVTVRGESPVVDVTTTRVGTSLKGDELTAIPNSTDVWGALSEAPGVRMQGFDVGGSHKSQQSAYEVFGVQNQARVVTEGIDHTEGVGGTGFYEDYFANEEYSISALGSDVEMNSGGAAIVAVGKSGGNVLSGLYHISYQPGEWVGDNNNDALRARGFTGNPNLLFWEGHADVGGPVVRDKIWFFGAYNHFKIDKVVSGVPQEIATDIGIFDNFTGKGTWKASENNTVIGYYQQGNKQKPQRGLSALRPPESIQAQDSWSRMYKGEWQRVMSNRTFLDVIVGNFSLDWPMVPAVDPVSRPPQVFRDTGAVAGAGWNSFTTGRKKPQVKAQMTYFLPKGGSHDFKFGYEYIYDWYRFGINGSNGPVRYSYPRAGAVADRIRFADTGKAGDFESTWRSSPNIDKHHAFYAQDRWTRNRLSVTAGVRLDYQLLAYHDSTRVPEIHDLLPNGTRIFPETSTVAGDTLVTNTDIAPRLGISYDVTGKGRTVFKAFYGRYFNNMADGFSSANPGGTNYAEYNFNDLNTNGRYDGPAELGAERLRIGGATTTVNEDLDTPYTDELSATVEHQFWGESSARFTYVRKMQRKFVPFYYTPLVPAWFGQLTVPIRVVSDDTGEVFNLRDIPASIADQNTGLFDNIPDSDFDYDTIEFAFNKRLGSRFFMQSSFDYQWRDELRSADIDNWGSTSPLVADPIGVNYFLNPNPAVSNRQETTVYHFTMMGRYVFTWDIGFAANYRFQSGFPYSRIIPDATTTPVLNATPVPFFVEDLKNNRSDSAHLLNFRVDKGFTMGKVKITGMFDLYNVLNSNPVTNFNLYNGGFGDIIAVLDPRVAQVGFRLEF
jgi:Carboxypeptidase regulatory-like domain